MKCIIVVNAYIKNNSQKYQAERIKEELCALGAQCEIVKDIDLAAISRGEISAVDAQVCVFLDKDRAAARLLEHSGIKLFNCAEAIEVCDDKMLTHIALANRGINMPDCVYAPLCYYDDAPVSTQLIDAVESKLGYPLVAKHCHGSLGTGVFLIKNRKELITFEQKNKLIAHFYQQYIECGGKDIRVLVIGKKYVCSMLRSNDSDFRSNISLGGHGEYYEADAQLIALCERVATILNLDYCGIDVLTDSDGKRYICEVNSNAFFAEAEKVCDINIAKKYAELIIASKNA